jgi:hypothetical protein
MQVAAFALRSDFSAHDFDGDRLVVISFAEIQKEVRPLGPGNLAALHHTAPL